MRIRLLTLCLTSVLVSLPSFAVEEDAEGCKDSPIVQRFPGSSLASCDAKDYDEVEVAYGVGPDKSIEMKRLEGQLELRSYTPPENASALQLMRNFEAAFRKAGAKILVGASDTESHDYVTAVFPNKAKTVVNIQMSAGSYVETIVTPKEFVQQVEANAGALMEELQKTGRVAVYGVNFETGKATLTSESDAVLQQVAELLKTNGALKLRVEGHTDNVGKPKANLALSKARAAAVKDWLVKHGVAAKRLTTDGFGDSKPLADNGSEQGRAKNRRVELVKL